VVGGAGWADAIDRGGGGRTQEEDVDEEEVPKKKKGVVQFPYHTTCDGSYDSGPKYKLYIKTGGP
jgi:hypothetical protein